MAQIADLIAQLRFKIGDTGTPPVFADPTLTREITQAMNLYDSSYTISSIQLNEEFLVILLAWSQVCTILACDNAKEYELSLDGMSIDKTVRVKNYLELAEFLMTQYKAKYAEFQSSANGSGGDIVEGELVREDVATGHTMPYQADSGLAAPKLDTPAIAGNKVSLSWSKVLSSDFAYYELCRSAGGVKTVVAALYDSHESTYEDEVPAGTYLYTVKVYDNSSIANESATQTAVIA